VGGGGGGGGGGGHAAYMKWCTTGGPVLHLCQMLRHTPLCTGKATVKEVEDAADADATRNRLVRASPPAKYTHTRQFAAI